MNNNEILLEVRGLTKHFPLKSNFWRRVIGHVRAVDGVDLFVRRGETLGLVGESGCGKTTLGRCILRAIEPTAGEVLYHLQGRQPVDFRSLSGDQLRQMRPFMQMVFQDPFSALDPRMTVYDIISEPLRANPGRVMTTIVERVKELMTVVGLNPQYMERYPHAFSTGQRQRISVARALATSPEFIVCDEPVSALDVSVRSQILNLLLELQDRYQVGYLFISHDLSVIHHISHRVAVMYVGKIVETASAVELFQSPKHPYTEVLLHAIPRPDPRSKRIRLYLSGELPNPANPPSGCYFHPRCGYAQEVCARQTPALSELSPLHHVACHFAAELNLNGVAM
ncbi:MAG: ABC transporter ATP-binding protein [Chloroflexi bacterium]|nr:ABC transporter ATP-binding protein [Chloroflexota bacterium]